MRVSELVFDFGLYPRQRIDTQHLAAMCRAVEAGADLPPIKADKKSKRIIDGFHRARTQQRIVGDDATIQVVLKAYKNEQEMLLDAIQSNANHGRNLSPFDRAHAILLGANLGIDTKALAGALTTTVDEVDALVTRKSATVGTGKLETRVPIKQTIGHMAGKRLSKGQAEAVAKLGGMNQLYYVNQLITLMESNLLDRHNEDLIEGLRKLHGLLDAMLAAA
jgi:hypothetical protein